MNRQRFIALAIGALGLFFTYLFQSSLDIYSWIFEFKPSQYGHYTSDFGSVTNRPAFVMNKIFRYLLNDGFSLAVIYGLFGEKKYVKFAVYVLIFGLFVLLPIYLLIFLYQPEGFTSMLSHLHRIVFNPVLMMMLIPAFYYQRNISVDVSKKDQ